MNGIIKSWNWAAEKIGYSSEEMIGKSVSILVPEDNSDEWMKILDILKRIRKLNILKLFALKKVEKS